MTVANLLQLVGFAALLSLGQLLFKRAALTVADRHALQAVLELALSPTLWAALALYGLATVLWVLILRTTPLSLAYPFAALGFVILPFLSWLFFGERLEWTLIAGTLLIVCGILLVAVGARA
jgi:drug/metabolite transporter (DMT)-like permease